MNNEFYYVTTDNSLDGQAARGSLRGGLNPRTVKITSSDHIVVIVLSYVLQSVHAHTLAMSSTSRSLHDLNALETRLFEC